MCVDIALLWGCLCFSSRICVFIFCANSFVLHQSVRVGQVLVSSLFLLLTSMKSFSCTLFMSRYHCSNLIAAWVCSVTSVALPDTFCIFGSRLHFSATFVHFERITCLFDSFDNNCRKVRFPFQNTNVDYIKLLYVVVHSIHTRGRRSLPQKRIVNPKRTCNLHRTCHNIHWATVQTMWLCMTATICTSDATNFQGKGQPHFVFAIFQYT